MESSSSFSDLAKAADCFNIRRILKNQPAAVSLAQRERVALLGIARRQICVNYPINSGNQKRANELKLNVKTAGDWLRVKRLEKNLTPGRVAAKMGIATSLVCSWENNIQQPDNHQLTVLALVFSFDAKDFEKFKSIR